MEKSYKSLANLTVYLVAALALGYALWINLAVPLWAVILFFGAVFGLSLCVNRPKRIHVKYFTDGLEPIQKISVGDWIDLRAAETVTLRQGEYYRIRLGVGMILPEGYEALVLPRSSTPEKFGIVGANSMGVIDNSYSGDGDEWHFLAVALRDTVINKGDRIAQFRIIENQPRLVFETVPHLKANNRGGIGSTGER